MEATVETLLAESVRCAAQLQKEYPAVAEHADTIAIRLQQLQAAPTRAEILRFLTYLHWLATGELPA